MKYHEACDLILDECRQALSSIPEADVEAFCHMIADADKVFFIAVGRVMLSLQSFAKRLSHLGVNCSIVGEITEPALTERDLLIVASGSGESLIPVAIATKAKKLGAKIIHIGSNPKSTLAPITDLMVRIPVQTKLYLEDEISSKQPMSSLFEQSLLLFGDAVCQLIVAQKSIDLKSLWAFHANLE